MEENILETAKKILEAVEKIEPLLCQHQEGDECEVALDILIILYNYGVAKERMDLVLELQKQLRERKVTIGVYGRHSIGKTTLLNALLSSSYLPASRVANTAVQVMIEHDEVDPVLKKSGMPVARGKENITQYITGVNESVGNGEQQKEKNVELSLSLRVPLLAGAPHTCKAVFLDTPGFMEAMRKRIAQVAQASLESSCAYLFVMNYEQMRDSGDAEILGKLHSVDQSFVTGGRIVFAVTKFDSSYTGYGEEPTLFQTQQHVREGLMRLGFDVPLDDIVPVSGQWALLARQLQPDSQPRELRCAQGYLIAFKGKQPHGEGEDSIDVQVHSMELQNMAKELEKASNILILEERLRKIVSACSHHLLEGIKSKVGSCATESLHDLEECLQNMNKKLEDVTTKEELLRKMHQIKSKLHKTANGTNPRVKRQIEQTACEDSEKACTLLLQVVERQLQAFQHNYEQTSERQQYTPEMLDRDFPQLMDCQQEISDSIRDINYEETRRVYEHEVLRGETSKDFRKLEELLKQHLPVAGNRIEGLAEDARSLLARVASREPLQLQDVCTKPDLGTWTFTEKLRLLIRKIIGYRRDGDPVGLMAALKSKGPYPREEDIQSIIHQTRDRFKRSCRQLYFEENGIKDQLTEAAFASYHMDVLQKLTRAEELCPTSEEILTKLVRERQLVQRACNNLEKLKMQLPNVYSKL